MSWQEDELRERKNKWLEAQQQALSGGELSTSRGFVFAEWLVCAGALLAAATVYLIFK
jgi:hypothetical protein